MPEAAFIVEGVQEQKIVKRLCPNSKAVLLGSNGDAVDILQIAKRIETLFNVFNNKYYPIFIIFDRENRQQSHDELYIELLNHLMNRNLPIDQFIIGIPDRKIESWIIPFIAEDGKVLTEAEQTFDGERCQGNLEKRLRDGGTVYHKTTTGCQLFCQINPSSLSKVSHSFRSFHEKAKNHCAWLNMFT